jgi:hypothetical protein
MAPLNIYIDYVAANDDDSAFANRIKERLKRLKPKVKITLFSDIYTNEDEWETNTLKEINKSDIIIPILSGDYLAFVTNSMAAKLDNIIDSKNKFLLPIYFKPSDWGSFNWVVKSKLIPEDNIPLSEYSDNGVEKILNELVRTVENIVVQFNEVPKKIKSTTKVTPVQSNNIIFISHDHDDSDFAELLKLRLEKNDLHGWIDSERLKIGQDWREEIDEGISKSLAVIVIMTPDARKSEYVTYEWAYAWGKDIKIFPIMLKQTQLHPRLESLQYLDFTNKATRPWDKLILSIKELIEK